jgi:LysR family transcriptional regulator, putative pyruvate carboxylase regulator
MGIDLVDLRVLVTAVACGSLSAAARELHLSQPSVSERLARLERVVGRPLLARSNRGVTPTPAGQRFLVHARRCLAVAERAVDVARAEDTSASLHVTAYSGYGTIAVPFVVQVLRPLRIAVIVDDQHSEEALRRVAERVTDLAFTLPEPHAHEVALRPFHRDPVIAVCAPGHPLAGRHLPLRELEDHDVAFNAWGSGHAAFAEHLHELGGPEHRRLAVSPAELVVQLARAGLALGLVTRSAAEHDLQVGTLVPVTITDLPPWHVEIVLAHHRDRAEEPAIRAVLSAVDGQATPAVLHGWSTQPRPVTVGGRD